MKTIDIFANVIGQAMRDRNIQKYGKILLARGIRGQTKLNPVVVWVDAALSVIEAANSYMRYSAACEVTQQFREYNRMLEVTLTQDLRIGEIELETLYLKREKRMVHIERTLKETHSKVCVTKEKIRIQLSQLKRMHALLQQARFQSGSFQKLIEFQVCLDRCIEATLILIITTTGE